MNKRTAVYALSLLIVAGAIGVFSASAHEGSHFFGSRAFYKDGNPSDYTQKMISHKAEILGLSEEDLSAALESGKTFAEIMEDQGLTREDLATAKKEYMKKHLSEKLAQMVADGEITQEEADEKLAQMENFDGVKKRGFKHGRFFKHSRFHIFGES